MRAVKGKEADMQDKLYQALDALTGDIAAFVSSQSEMNATFAPGGTTFQCVAFPSGKVLVGYLVEVNGDLAADSQWEIMVDTAAERARPVAYETTLGRMKADDESAGDALESVREAIARFERGAMQNVETVAA